MNDVYEAQKSRIYNPQSAIRDSYIAVAMPQFTPPKKAYEAMDLEAVNTSLKQVKADIDALSNDAKQLQVNVNQRKKLHATITKLYRKLCKIDIFTHELIIKRIGQRRRVNIHRRNVISELFKAFVLYHDLLTGVLPKSCLTTLSDQLKVTTYGRKRYGEYAGKILPAQDKTGKRKSISRVSRAIRMLEEWDIIEVHRSTDKVTGKELPAIIVLKDIFYTLLLESASDVEAMRLNKLREDYYKACQKSNKLLSGEPLLTPTEQLEALTELRAEKIQKIKREREVYAMLKRQRKGLDKMSKAEIQDKAAYDVVNHINPDILESMSDERYQSIVKERVRSLYKLRSNPLLQDTFFSEHLRLGFS